MAIALDDITGQALVRGWRAAELVKEAISRPFVSLPARCSDTLHRVVRLAAGRGFGVIEARRASMLDALLRREFAPRVFLVDAHADGMLAFVKHLGEGGLLEGASVLCESHPLLIKAPEELLKGPCALEFDDDPSACGALLQLHAHLAHEARPGAFDEKGRTSEARLPALQHYARVLRELEEVNRSREVHFLETILARLGQHRYVWHILGLAHYASGLVTGGLRRASIPYVMLRGRPEAGKSSPQVVDAACAALFLPDRQINDVFQVEQHDDFVRVTLRGMIEYGRWFQIRERLADLVCASEKSVLVDVADMAMAGLVEVCVADIAAPLIAPHQRGVRGVVVAPAIHPVIAGLSRRHPSIALRHTIEEALDYLRAPRP